MKKPNRIGLSLFDDELIQLINASAKIFPITQGDVNANLNPNNYEYGRIGNEIYRWDGSRWNYIIADDTNIEWSDIKSKPVSYPPSEHNHADLHTHNNKSIIDTITQLMIDTWNTVTGKADKTYVDTELGKKSNSTHDHDLVYSKLPHVHPYAPEIHNHDDMYYTLSEVDTKLLTKSDNVHNHDGGYYKKSEVDSQMGGKAPTVHNHTEAQITDLNKYTKQEIDTKLGGKSNTEHGHTELHNHINKPILEKIIETVPKMSYDLSQIQYIEDIRAGYTEGHAHSNLSILQSITQVLIDAWDSAVIHISNKVNPHAVTKAQVSLGSVLNYGIATKAEAEVGTSNVKYMTPLVVKNAIDKFQYVHPTNHDDWYNTKAEINSLMLMKADLSHSHDDKYYTETEVDNKLSSKVESNTFTGHTGNATVHVTQTDKDNLTTVYNSGAGRYVAGTICNDANTATLSGNYMLTDLNKPVGVVDCALSVISYSDIWVTQLALDWRTNQVYSRMCSNGLWSAWNKLGGSGIEIGTVKPTNGSMWYKVIG